jgi:micrococcal nuclease
MKKILFVFLVSFILVILVRQKFKLNQLTKTNQLLTPTEKPSLILTINPVFTFSLTPSPIPIFYSVVKVVDGDTIDVDIDGQVKRVRIIGINTPEVVDLRREVECFGKQASEKAKNILQKKKVRLEKDPTQGEADKYGRLLRFVFLEDGTDFGLLMIKEGYAYEYTYNLPYKYQQQYKNAQKEAQENKKGLWEDNICPF